MKATRKQIREYLKNARAMIQKGNSRNSAGFGNSTPIDEIQGSMAPPKLDGLPHLHTNFRRGSFSKTLYTHSTLRATVGEFWTP